MRIEKFRCENLESGCVTDNGQPTFSYILSSDKPTDIKIAEIEVDGQRFPANDCTAVKYSGKPLKPFTDYTAKLYIQTSDSEELCSSVNFSTGRMGASWHGKWITDASYKFTQPKTSPVPLTFRKKFKPAKAIKSAKLYFTALGIYE